ncbi:hypothetical protein L3X38_009549 [Prunus dulcis]|uniref:Uncharacterized protein n=1 Tax=Prunus dulcis TaxID=3755 RepID=A0AAD4WFF1_PRUDU|nr:hypothetical protein L3X38_009549 [Prunus dulcis]
MWYHTTFVDDKDTVVWQIKLEHVFLMETDYRIIFHCWLVEILWQHHDPQSAEKLSWARTRCNVPPLPASQDASFRIYSHQCSAHAFRGRHGTWRCPSWQDQILEVAATSAMAYPSHGLEFD